MTISFLQYPLVNGFIQNWLVAGPQVLPAKVTEGIAKENFHRQLAQKFYKLEIEITEQPVVRGKLSEGIFEIEGYQGSWEYYGCLEDHLVNQSGCYLSPRYLRSWAYTQLDCREKIAVQFCLTTPGHADLWVNQEHILRKDTFSEVWPATEIV